MNKRCIVNVATGDFYCKMQQRLYHSFKEVTDDVTTLYASGSPWKSFKNVDKGIDVILWSDCLPPGSRPHSESPYGFKVHAFKAAYEKGYTSILWLDSPAYAVKEDISPIFDKIERLGYYAMSHIDPLENYVGVIAASCFGLTRDSLKGFNLPSGSCYGFDLSSEIGERIFGNMVMDEEQGLFFSDKEADLKHGAVHRHDEAILALNLIKLNLPVFTFDPLFQSDSPECVIKSGGEWQA